MNNMINGCFGVVDKKFAGHPEDEERAFQLLIHLRKNNIGWKELEKAIRKHLKDTLPPHVEEQVLVVSSYMKPWIPD